MILLAIGVKFTPEQEYILSYSSHDDIRNALKTGVFSLKFSSEHFRANIRTLIRSFEFYKTWQKDQFIWFLCGEERMKEYDYKKINQEKIEKSAPAVKEIIYGDSSKEQK